MIRVLSLTHTLTLTLRLGGESHHLCLLKHGKNISDQSQQLVSSHVYYYLNTSFYSYFGYT